MTCRANHARGLQLDGSMVGVILRVALIHFSLARGTRSEGH
jgi:hypothetical protein